MPMLGGTGRPAAWPAARMRAGSELSQDHPGRGLAERRRDRQHPLAGAGSGRHAVEMFSNVKEVAGPSASACGSRV